MLILLQQNSSNIPLIQAIATITVAILALFGEPIRRHFFRPMVTLGLRNIKGIASIYNNTHHRYYHLQLSTCTWRDHSENICVVIEELHELRDDTWELIFNNGPIPLQWQYEYYVKQVDTNYATKTLGANAKINCDLCYLQTRETSETTTGNNAPVGEFFLQREIHAYIRKSYNTS